MRLGGAFACVMYVTGSGTAYRPMLLSFRVRVEQKRDLLFAFQALCSAIGRA